MTISRNLSERDASKMRIVGRVAQLIFVVSGISALVYQLAWQRVMFVEFGCTTESISLVVAAFIFGLGTGALIGGYISKADHVRLPVIFALFELFTGCFGTQSIWIIKWTAFHVVKDFGYAATAAACFAVVLIPTLAMGASLPILVHYISLYTHSVRYSTSILYCSNTAGAAIGAFITCLFLFRLFGLSRSVELAALLNVFCGLSVLVVTRYANRRFEPE